MSTTKSFPTLDVASVYTGTLVSDRGIEAIYDVCGFMLGDDLMTHQLPAASRAIERDLECQHPWLADLDPPKGDLPALKAWCADLVEERGTRCALTPAENPAWTRHNGIADLLQIADGRTVIVVEAGGDSA